MIILNETKKTTISGAGKKVSSFLDKNLGLLKKSNPHSLLFKTRFGIHTFFLKESIDVVILDEGCKVVNIYENLKPNRIFFWNPIYDLVLELPKGTIRKSRTKAGDLIIFR